MKTTKKDPWTDPDPQPGDFDEYLAEVDPADVQYIEPGEGFEVIFIGTDDVEGWLKKNRGRAGAKTADAERASSAS
jgi:hypothetical protein